MRKIVFSGIALLAITTTTLSAKTPQTGSSIQAQQSAGAVSGKVSTWGGKYYITDETTRTTYEVRGENLQRWAGQNVRVTGQIAQAAAGEPDVITLSHIDRLGGAAASGSSKAAAAGMKAGLSKAAIVAMVGGGATAATVGSLYATNVIGGDDQSVSRR